MESTNVPLSKRLIGIGLAAVCIIGSMFIPGTEALGHQGIMTLGLLLALVSLWVTSALPLGVTALFVVVMCPVLGIVGGLGEAIGGFASPALFFIISVFSLPVIMLKTNWGVRLISTIIKWTGTNSRKLVLGFMIATTLVSTVMSDVPCTVLFLGFALTILKATDAKPLESNLGRCLMIGIPIAAVTGGMATPAGSSFNVVAMNILQQATGTSISFLNWVCVALPVVIVMTPITWFFITQILKPEPIADSALQGIRDQAAAAKKVEPHEVKTLVIIVGLLALWIIGNWVPVLNATVVALIGLTLMFVPGMQLLTWKEFQNSVPWGIVLMCGTIMSMGSVVEKTGGAKFLADLIAGSGVMDLGFFAAFALLLALIYLIHTVCPIGVAILGIFLPIMITLCAGFGVSPAVPTIALAVVVAGNYLMPVNPTVMLTYGEGYYTFGDMFKTGIVPAIALILIMAAWMPFIVGAIGI
ncbi:MULTISPECIES: SLC13 family permease [Gordonibacter]|uniref:Sodium-dependent dicarboxylate transporter SdcS n=1 Tax=Gordonibacter faecis TaxID=3047475 RepID=A0ABT7DSY4_9ACTN|nr:MULTISPECIES: SLC13 family permease [unclassified Gordonibacter]MDJ1651275.1 SLC13 family permease [Gordonibacter sp. KGMB12511]